MKHKSAIAFLAMIVLIGAAAFPGTSHAQVTYTTYIVQPGDNLYRIGLKFGIRADKLAQANGIVNPNLIYSGEHLIIPGGSIVPPVVATAAATSDGSVTATPEPPSNPAPTTYIVQIHDNLYRIALKFNTTIFILSQLNGIANPNVIYIGQVLRLPNPGAIVSGPVPNMAVPASTVDASQPTNPTVAATPEVAATEAIVPAATEAVTTVATAAPTQASGGGQSGVAQVAVAANVGFAVGVVVKPGLDLSSGAQTISTLGATWVRQVADWRTLEKAQGTLDYSSLDGLIAAYSSANLKVLLTLTNAPDWARPTSQEDGPPSDSGTFAAFAGAIAEHFKGQVSAYEIWNEPNLRKNWNGRPLSAAGYVELLRRAYTAIKAVDRGALVISAGLSPTGFNDGVNAIDDRVFLKQAYTAGIASYVDAIGVHPGGWANPPDSSCCQASPGVTGWFNSRSFYFRDTLSDDRQIMKDNGDSAKFIWVTAFGWGANEGVADASTVNDNSFGFVKFTSQAKQAQYVTRALEIGRDLSFVGPMFVDNLNGCQAAGSDASASGFYPCYYALLDASGSPRPAYQAIGAFKK